MDQLSACCLGSMTVPTSPQWILTHAAQGKVQLTFVLFPMAWTYFNSNNKYIAFLIVK